MSQKSQGKRQELQDVDILDRPSKRLTEPVPQEKAGPTSPALWFLGRRLARANWPSVPMGTFHFAENLRRKLLIYGAGFWADPWNQGVRLWKECLLSRGSDDYESRLDAFGVYFIRCMAGGDIAPKGWAPWKHGALRSSETTRVSR